MNYVETVNSVFSIIPSIIYSFFVHYTFLAIAGVFTYKRYPKAVHKNRYGLIIPAKNEEAVIANIINNVRSCEYPQELLDIFVVAHNSSDKTAEYARNTDAHVYEYNNPEENTMGFAIRYLFKKIEEDFKTSSYDGFFIFNADNTFEKNYFDKMNDAFEYYDKKCVVSSFRQASNFNENLMTVMYGVYFAASCYLGARGRTLFNTSNRIFGCGYLFSKDLVKDGWDYYSLTEDLELSAREFIKGTQIRYCDEAIFYDEQPTSFRIMWRQRLRWARGILIVSRRHFTSCVKAIFERNRKNRFAVFDMATFCSRVTTVIVFMFILRFIILLFTPLFNENISDAFLYWDNTKTWYSNLFISNKTGLFFSTVSCFINFYIISVISYLLTMFVGRNRFKSGSLFKTIIGVFFFPFFLICQFIFDIQALLSDDLDWKQIPHTGKRDF